MFIEAGGSTTRVLPDPHKHMAKMHYLKSFFFFADMSMNTFFLKHGTGQEHLAPLTHSK